MSQAFKDRLFPLVPQLYRDFRPTLIGDVGVPVERCALSPGFHIYDEAGIRNTIRAMHHYLFTSHRGTNYFAVKACPNLEILRIMVEMGFGLDCSSPAEIHRARMAGATPSQIMYTSNNTQEHFYPFALDEGCVLNLDDLSFIATVPQMPEQICFRYNPGPRRQEGTDAIIGNPVDQKFGLRHDQIVEAFDKARDRGARVFGLHTMYVSNSLDPAVLAGNARMLLQVAAQVQAALGIKFAFINIGGGLGINYRPEQKPLDIELLGELINVELAEFEDKHDYVPRLYLESGRYVTGPHGVLVGRVVNLMDKYRKFVGVDFSDSADLLRAGMYPAYHEISILNRFGVEKRIEDGWEEVSIVGPLCENMHMVSRRKLPVIEVGDFVVVHDDGAHAAALTTKYNDWGSSQQLLLNPHLSVRRIARAETVGDLLAREMVIVGQSSPEWRVRQY